ncbi:hypothetical protein LCGC14_0038140 [marine sediment metagenome]|uniref:DUF4160 domain-containing protein n=1 Tax=marine sediment metagenome TaxID=412755 RepID=A0A0F9YBA9_9ZZZZ|nr:DUF4160 domain-containing protein [Halomonas sp.]
MPTISMFYGIIIRMTMHRRSIHRRIFMSTMVSIGPPLRKQTKLVLAWAELHQEDLMADWDLVMNDEEPFKIQPLQ